MTARIVYDLPEADYFAHPALSQSGAKDMLVSPAHYLWRRDNREESTAFDLGHAAHSLVLGVGQEPTRAGFQDKRTKAWSEFEATCRTEGKVPLTDPEYALVHAMADKLSEHTLAMQLLSEGTSEVALFADDIVPIRGRLDWLGARVATDYKTTARFEPAAWSKTVAAYGYHIQAAWYLRLLELLDMPQRAFAFIVQSKAPPFDVFVSDLKPEALARGRELMDRAQERFRDCTESGLWPGAVPADAFLTVDIPRWAHYDDNLEEAMSYV